MRTKLVTCVSGAALALGALAPIAALAGPEWGVKGGLSVADVRWENAAVEPESKLGFAGGASARFALASKDTLSPKCCA